MKKKFDFVSAKKYAENLNTEEDILNFIKEYYKTDTPDEKIGQILFSSERKFSGIECVFLFKAHKRYYQ